MVFQQLLQVGFMAPLEVAEGTIQLRLSLIELFGHSLQVVLHFVQTGCDLGFESLLLGLGLFELVRDLSLELIYS